ncbi:MAG: cation diffusion facilitator family transporter [Candidatus Omnitrophota bacterium]|nr:cation diffusion facilitator family transporter [Candidatus Omnitrophota bacterium]
MSIHAHHRSTSGGMRALRLALLLTAAMMVIEGVAGWLSGSLSLLADAVHMLTDASALALSLFAAWFSTRPATPEKSYGYYRTEILAALANGVALWLIVVWIYTRAFHRLQHPLPVLSNPMIAIAAVGLAVNLLCGWILRGERASSLNVQGAWLNVMSDALGSVGVIVAGLLIRWYGWTAADPIAGMVIGLLIARNSWNLITQSVNILLEGAPQHLQIPEVIRAMRTIPGVHDIHDVHLWTITTGMEAMSGHVIVEDVSQSDAMLSGLNALLSERFGITHTTLQLEPRDHACRMEVDAPTRQPSSSSF